jgi:hypothetical protein
MALFRKRSVPVPPPAKTADPPVVFVPVQDQPTLRPLVDALGGGDWRPAHEALEATVGWGDRLVVLDALQHAPSFPDDWVTSAPSSAFPLVARGAFHIRQAWKARGSGRAHDVTQDGWRGFTEHLDLAADDLQRAMETSASDPTPWAYMVTVAMGLSMPKDEIIRIVAESDARALGLRHVYARATTALSHKWGGSHQLMLDFVRDAAVRLPDGSEGLDCVAGAHIEVYTYLKNFEKNEAEQTAYFKQADVASELADAADRSVFSPEYRRTLVTRSLWSDFAFCMALVGDAFPEHRPMSAELFRLLGDDIPPVPWELAYGYGAAPSVCAAVRRVALQRVG